MAPENNPFFQVASFSDNARKHRAAAYDGKLLVVILKEMMLSGVEVRHTNRVRDGVKRNYRSNFSGALSSTVSTLSLI